MSLTVWPIARGITRIGKGARIGCRSSGASARVTDTCLYPALPCRRHAIAEGSVRPVFLEPGARANRIVPSTAGDDIGAA